MLLLLLISSCSEEPEMEKAATSVEPINDAEVGSWEGYRDVDGSYRSDSAGFVVRFPEGAVVYEKKHHEQQGG